MKNINHHFLHVLFYLYLLALLWLLFFFPYTHASRLNPDASRTMHLLPFTTTSYYLRQAIYGGQANLVREALINIGGNLLLFFPLGLYLGFYCKFKAFQVWLALPGVSLVIEVLQWLSQRGNFDVDDILLNSLGGYLAYTGIQWLSKRINRA